MAEQKISRKVVISSMLGNGLEWYDYALYGQMAGIFANLFFPKGDAAENLILTYLAFAAGFIARPLGAVLFGQLGDKYGRKKALVASMILMAVPTGCIGLLPTYEMIGMAAPILLLLIRILQGLSLGGAFSGSMSYVVEHAPQNQRAFAGSVTMMSLVMGFVFGSLVSTLIASFMSAEDFHSWGWRLPFFFGVGIGFVGYYLRHHGEESPVYEEAKASGALSPTPVREAFSKYPASMLRGFVTYLFVTVPFYTIAIYMISFSTTHLGLSSGAAIRANAIAMVAMFLPMWPMARLADRIGRRTILLGAMAAMAIAAYPAYHLMLQGAELATTDAGAAFWRITLAQSVLALILGWYLAPIPAFLVEMFPTRIRYTGLSLSYNFCAILGGFTPALAVYMIKETGDLYSSMYLVIGTALITFATLYRYRDRWREPLS